MTDDTERSTPVDREVVRAAVTLLRFIGCDRHANEVDALVDERVYWRKRFFDAEMSVLAVRHARDLMNRHGVPQAAFFDDHVANALAQRNRMQDAVEDLRRKLDANWIPNSAPEWAEKIKFMADVAATLAEYGHGQQAHYDQAKVYDLQAPPSGGA